MEATEVKVHVYLYVTACTVLELAALGYYF